MRRITALGVAAIASFLIVGSASGQIFSSSGGIAIPSGGHATPYPSVINVAGGPTSITGIAVKLQSFTHTYPSDLQVMVEAPNGTLIQLMQTNGGGTPAVNADLTFWDAGAALPSAIVTGTYRPNGGSYSFVAPAPAGPHSPVLASVAGSNANGAWKLWVEDAAAGDSGTLAGWSVQFFDGPTAPTSVFTYQGRLDGGTPGDAVNARFTMWDSPTSNEPFNRMSETITATGTLSGDGTFTIPVGFSSPIPGDRKVWLAIEVESPAGSGYTALAPRQLLTATPIASVARSVAYSPSLMVGTVERAGADQHAELNRGVKTRVGYGLNSAGTGEFLGMQALVAPGTAGCGNSGDLAFFTWECNTSPSREIMRINGRGNVGIGTNAPTQKLTVNGNVLANNVAVPSSIRFKDHVSPLDDALARLTEIEGVRFDWKPQWAADRDGRVHDIGFVAEDVEKVFPEIVFRNEAGEVIGMDYSRMTAVAVSAIKQLKQENDELKCESAQLKAESEEIRARLEELEAAVNGARTK